MIDVEKVLTEEVREARKAVPCRSSEIVPANTSIYDVDSLRIRGAGDGLINKKLADHVDAERRAIIEAMRHHYGKDFLTWFCSQAVSKPEDNNARASVVIAHEMSLPERQQGCHLTVEGLAVVVALYDLDKEDYASMPMSLLVSSHERGYEPLIGPAQARNVGVVPTDFALMGPPHVDS